MEYLVRSNPKMPDFDRLIQLVPNGGNAFEIRVPMIFNRSVLVETSDDLHAWQPWDVPGNSPDFPAAAGGFHVLDGQVDEGTRFFRASFSAP